MAAGLRWALPALGVGSDAISRGTFTRMDALAAGAFVAVAFREPVLRVLCRRIARPIAILCTVGVAIAVWSKGELDWQPALSTLLAVLFAAWVFSAADGGWPALAAPWLRSVGRYSYAMYLFHIPLSRMTQRPFRMTIGGAPETAQVALKLLYIPAAIAATYALAWVSWALLEERVNRLKERIG
jgi:peptidoglycan/LPS O-acetylase OafA/YrhL